MENQNKVEKISVIGLGAMGKALANTFVEQGKSVTVWNRTDGKDVDLVNRGASSAIDIKQAIENGHVIVICVLNNGVAKELFYPYSNELPGKTIVNLTNGTPAEAREIAEWAARHNISYIDGGIMAVPPMIGTPESLILYSGNKIAFDRYQETLKLLGNAQYLGKDSGIAALFDLALLSGMYGVISGFIHAVAMVKKETSANDFMPLLIPWLQSMTLILPGLAKQIDTKDYEKDVVSNLGMQATAFNNILTTSHDQGISTALMAPIKAMMDEAIKKGYANSDVSSLIEVI